ncbi:NAD-dependent protein deacetylase sirtuin-3-like [Elysia marginata]|uniref:NAD-dependent protein deacetylase sirtuin-3-like n=1 Tax=Elysia marginata TaxID=1093978 RepID=A0AAV4FG24_9GAST|nr:NAD-dependent protein deacetylase sirtuin-3-like [Elysia marginata]
MKPGVINKSPSLSPSPPLRHARKFGSGNTGGKSGNQSDSDSGITAGFRDLSLGNRGRIQSGPKQFDNRRTFCSNGSRLIIRNLTDIANMLKDGHAKNVVIVAGAGISTPCGIPDFRTPGTGLYDNLQQYNVPYPEAIFDIDFFHHNPRPFFTLAKELYPSGKYRPNYIHYFARLLSDRGVLLRMYTQNIDGLERLAGVPPDKLVEAHGTFVTASCVICREKHRGAEIKDAIFDDKLPHCKKTGCYGIVKPDIVFFGEELPKRFYFYLKDMLQTDLVLVMGTSLEVQPFAGIIDTVRWTVPRVLFNRNAVGPFKSGKRSKDFISEGDLIECLQNFVSMAGMKDDMIDLITSAEGAFRLFAPPPPESTHSKPVKKVLSVNKSDPFLAAMWRQNARANLFSDSDSSDSSDLTESESESTSSSGKRPMNSKLPASNKGSKPGSNHSSPSKTSKPIKPSGNHQSSPKNGASNGRPPSGKGLIGSGRAAIGNRSNNNSSGATGQTRNYTSLLSRRKAATPPIQARRFNPSPSPTHNTDNSWTGNMVRRKPPLEASIGGLGRKPPQSPGSHPMKPRSNSVNKATPEKAHSNKVGGFRSVIDRVRSAKPAPRLTYHHRPSPKAMYDARIMTFNATTSSSSDDDDDDDDREDLDDSSSSSDSR